MLVRSWVPSLSERFGPLAPGPGASTGGGAADAERGQQLVGDPLDGSGELGLVARLAARARHHLGLLAVPERGGEQEAPAEPVDAAGDHPARAHRVAELREAARLSTAEERLLPLEAEGADEVGLGEEPELREPEAVRERLGERRRELGGLGRGLQGHHHHGVARGGEGAGGRRRGFDGDAGVGGLLGERRSDVRHIARQVTSGRRIVAAERRGARSPGRGRDAGPSLELPLPSMAAEVLHAVSTDPTRLGAASSHRAETWSGCHSGSGRPAAVVVRLGPTASVATAAPEAPHRRCMWGCPRGRRACQTCDCPGRARGASLFGPGEPDHDSEAKPERAAVENHRVAGR